MFSLQGENVKMSSKPPVPPKSTIGRRHNSTNGEPSRPQTASKSSPYYSTLNKTTVSARRVQSANTFQSTFSTNYNIDRNTSIKSKSSVSPKKTLAVFKPAGSTNSISSNQRKPYSFSSPLSKTEFALGGEKNLISFESSSSNGSSTSSIHRSFESGDNPFIDETNDVKSSSTSQSFLKNKRDRLSMPRSDQEENDDFFDSTLTDGDVDTLLNSNKKKTLDQRSFSLDFEVAEKPEENLLDGNPNVGFNSTKNDNGKHMGDSDAQLLSESDSLLKDVVKLCDNIGIASKDIEDLKQNKAFNAQDEQEKSEGSNVTESTVKLADGNDSESDATLHNLSSISCPSAVLNQSGVSTSRTVVEQQDNGGYYFNYEDSIITSSRPSSAKQLQRRLSNSSSLMQDETYALIISALEQIEDEERKQSATELINQLGDFILKSQRSSPTQQLAELLLSRCNSRQENESEPILSSNLPSTVNSEKNDQTCTTNKDLENENNVPISGRSFSSCTCTSTARDKQRRLEFSNDSVISSPGRSNKSVTDSMWETADEKTKKIFSFLDEVEKTDRETLFSLKFEQTKQKGSETGLPNSVYGNSSHHDLVKSQVNRNTCSKAGFNGARHFKSDVSYQTLDSLIRRGSVELARDVVILERKLEETVHHVAVLEETLLNQRELNVKNLKNAEKDLTKRLKLQQEEFEMAVSRHQSFVDQLISEKRGLQDKCEKLFLQCQDTEQKYQERIKSMQTKHLEEIKRIRRMQANAETAKKQKWLGSKTQEIKELTVKGLEPEIQRMINRHQQEMNEMRAWHADELKEAEDRYQRRLHMQIEELKEKYAKENEEVIKKERENATKKIESELKMREQELENTKRRIMEEISQERENFIAEEMKLKDTMLENVRKTQIKGEVELSNLKQEYETKIAALDKKHENELQSLKDVCEAEKQSWMVSVNKKHEMELAELTKKVEVSVTAQREGEAKEREKKLRNEFERIRLEDEMATEARVRRMQDKFNQEISELEKSEQELKLKLSQFKSQLLSKEEEIFSLKTTLNLKEKQNSELSTQNLKMSEERGNITSVIRREFSEQIESLEKEIKSLKTQTVELQAKIKMDQEQHSLELDRVRMEKEGEIEKIGLRVKQALTIKEETIDELQKQLEKSSFRISHLEELLEQQRKDFVNSITAPNATGSKRGHNNK